MLEIKGWDETFECSASRKLKELKWFAFPIETNSSGYIELMSRGQEGFAVYGIFCGLLALAGSRVKGYRGKLCKNDGTPLTEKQISAHLRIDSAAMVAALNLLKSKEIGWITDCSDTTKNEPPPPSANEVADSATNPPPHAHASATIRPTHNIQGEQVGQGGDNTHTKAESVIPKKLDTTEFREVWDDYGLWVLSRSGSKLCPITAKHQLSDLHRRGHDKAIADLKLTMRSATKPGTIWDSEKYASEGRASPKTFHQQKTENTLAAAQRFLEKNRKIEPPAIEGEVISERE